MHHDTGGGTRTRHSTRVLDRSCAACCHSLNIDGAELGYGMVSHAICHSHAARDLAPPGDLTTQQSLPFEFNSVEMEHDSYRGLQVRLRCAAVLDGLRHCWKTSHYALTARR